MADPTLADPFATLPFDSAFVSNLPLSFDDDNIDFSLDDFLNADLSDFLNSDILNDAPDFPPDSLTPIPIDDPSGGSVDVSDYIHVSSPDSPQDPFRVSPDRPSPGPASSQGSKNSNSGNSVSKSPVSVLSNDSTNGVVDQKIKSEEGSNKNPILKRKKILGSEDRTKKYRKPNSGGESVIICDGEEKKKARLERNRESAQLSRQRKKHYVEELEDKVRAMHSTINDLNSRITYIMAENASLRMQVGGAPPPGAYPHPPMGYPWVPYAPYMGSKVPLVPIPRLKTQQPEPASKRSESKRRESKPKKVASVSFLGLLFFMMLFGGLLPMMNFKFGEMNESFSGKLNNFSNGSIGNGFVDKSNGENSSEPLVASLYVPRNDKLVKIDGNLIIHSIMASEKAMASNKEGEVRKREETSLAVAGRNNVPTIIPLSGRNRHPQPYMALGGERDEMMSSRVDNKLQQWYMEGLAGPMLSSGMCTEVFQFDVSPAAGAIAPVTLQANVSSKSQNLKNVTTKLVKGRNRRILLGVSVPLVGSEKNITEKTVKIDPEKDNFKGNNSLSSMVVSVLVDPREAGDGNGDGVMGPKSLSRIFVVVLIDSVKYVTYSCMLPRIGSGAHLVTT